MSTTSDDEAVLRMLGGAHFGPDASLVLPTGRRLTGAEAQDLIGMVRDFDETVADPSAPSGGAGGRVVRVSPGYALVRGARFDAPASGLPVEVAAVQGRCQPVPP